MKRDSRKNTWQLKSLIFDKKSRGLQPCTGRFRVEFQSDMNETTPDQAVPPCSFSGQTSHSGQPTNARQQQQNDFWCLFALCQEDFVRLFFYGVVTFSSETRRCEARLNLRGHEFTTFFGSSWSAILKNGASGFSDVVIRVRGRRENGRTEDEGID